MGREFFLVPKFVVVLCITVLDLSLNNCQNAGFPMLVDL